MTHSILQSRWTDILRLLNADNIRPHLFAKKLLTWNESEKLVLLSRGNQATQEEQVETLLRYVIQKGSQHENLFLDALKSSVSSGSTHLGHDELITLLENDLEKQSASNGQSEFCERDGICFRVQPVSIDENSQAQFSDGLPLPSQASSNAASTSGGAMPVYTRSQPELGQFSYVSQARFSWQEREEMKCQIVKDSRIIMRKYASLVLNVYRLLQKKQVAFEEVQIALLHLGCFLSRPSSPTFFSESNELSRAKTIPELVCSLHNYTSWFNYDLIKFLATEDKLGGVDGQIMIGEYEADLREFFKKYVFECPQFAIERETPSGFQEFEMKIDWDYNSCQTQQIAIFKSTVSELLGIRPYALQLKNVEEGCVLTTWIVPSTIIPHVLETVLQKVEELSFLNVMMVRIAGKCIEINKPLQHPLHNIKPHLHLMSTKGSSLISPDHHRLTRELTVISEGSSTNVSLSDLTDPSTPKDRHSFISSCGSASAARLSKISLSSLATFWSPETVSNEEAEILSLYSGEISPCSTMERPPSKINHSFPLRVDSSISSVSDGASMKQLSKSVQQLSAVGGKTGLSSKPWFKSESDIARKASCNSKEKKKKFCSHKPTQGRAPFQSLMKWVNRRRKSSNPSPKSPPQEQQRETSIAQREPDQLLVHELDEEPVTTPARLFYFSLAEDLKPLPAASPNDGTSVASLIEWQPLEPKSSVTPSTSGEMSTLVKVNFEDQSQSSISLSQSGSQETILSNEFSRSDPSRSSLSTMSTMSSATYSLQRMSRVGSPSNSSGYHSESRQSSQLSLFYSESFGTRSQLSPEDQCFDIEPSPYKVKRHRSMNSHSQHTIHDASPLVRIRSNSMHK